MWWGGGGAWRWGRKRKSRCLQGQRAPRQTSRTETAPVNNGNCVNGHLALPSPVFRNKGLRGSFPNPPSETHARTELDLPKKMRGPLLHPRPLAFYPVRPASALSAARFRHPAGGGVHPGAAGEARKVAPAHPAPRRAPRGHGFGRAFGAHASSSSCARRLHLRVTLPSPRGLRVELLFLSAIPHPQPAPAHA